MYCTCFLGIWIVLCWKFIYWGSFKFTGHVANSYRCHCMSLQSAGVSFLKFSKVLLEWLMTWLCFYNVKETWNTWVLIDLVSFRVGKEWPLGIVLFIIHWYSLIPSELSCRSNECYVNFKPDRTLHLLAF